MADTEFSRTRIHGYTKMLVVDRDPYRAFATYFSPGLIQHDPDIGNGNHGDEAFLEERRLAKPDACLPEDQYATVIHHLLADGDLVAMKSHVFISPDDPGRVFVDIWRLEDGRFAEHWSAIETIPRDALNPLPMWCGKGGTYAEAAALDDTLDAPICGAPGNPALREPSLAVVRAFLDMVRDPARIAEAIDRFVADDFIEYAPRAGQGRQALVDYLSARAAAGDTFEEARLLADGDLILIHGRARTDEDALGFSQMHLFRVADDRIVAHWGVRQAIPAYSVAGRSMVQGPLEEGRVPGGPKPGEAAH